jgi:hypothetical protein
MEFNSDRLTGTWRVGALTVAIFLFGGVALSQILSSAEVKKLTSSASTSADHLKLAKHYEAVAARHEADAKEHEALAAEYSRNPTGHDQKHPMSGKTAAHCKTYAEHCRKAASAAREMAAAHTEMAKQDSK